MVDRFEWYLTRQTVKTIAHRRAKPPTAPPAMAPTGVDWWSPLEAAVVLAAAALPVAVGDGAELEEVVSVDDAVLEDEKVLLEPARGG